MGVYTRFKKNGDGLRQLVELWESTPPVRRQKMISVGMEEDPEYTQRILSLLFTFDEVLKLNDLELAEVAAETAPASIGYALHESSPEIKKRVLSKIKPNILGAVMEILNIPEVPKTLVEAGKMKMIEAARKLERKNVIAAKQIPAGTRYG